MKRICKYCGVEFDGAPGSISCPVCAQDHKKSTLRARTCRKCGTVFAGGPRAWYCPSCRHERKKEADRSYKKRGAERLIGSIDRCIICGKDYVVNGSMQRYCKDCAPSAIKSRDSESSLKYYYDNITNNDFDLFFTTDGSHFIIPYDGIKIIELCYILKQFSRL